MKRFSLLCLLGLIQSLSFAEQGPNAAPPGQQQQGPRSSAIQVWDDRVFDLGEKAPPPTTRKGASGTERYLGAEPDYNRGQRDAWLEACEPLKSDLRAYRKCFANEKQRSNEAIQANRAEVEGRSALPMRNVPSPTFDSENQRNPAYDVQVERQIEEE